jgi:hypothetical protein
MANLQRMTTHDVSVTQLLTMKDDAEKNSGEQQAELALWHDIVNGTTLIDVTTDTTACDSTANLVNWLNSLAVVEVAYAVPKDGPLPVIPWMPPGVDLTTPSQAWEPPHLSPYNPTAMTWGLNSPEVSGFLSDEFRLLWQGYNVAIVDMERNWYQHEKIGGVYRIPGGVIGNAIPNDDAHGTATMAIAFGTNRSGLISTNPRYGTRGFAPQALRGFTAANRGWGTGWSAWPAGISRASEAMDPGDVLYIEQQAFYTVGSDTGESGIVVEIENATYDAIRTVTALGRIVCEPTGNGATAGGSGMPTAPNAVDPLTTNFRPNSGAIVVSASGGGAQAIFPMIGGGFGNRVDAHGWGGMAMTAAPVGYAGIPNLGPNMPADQNYIAAFRGTSGATPMVAGAVGQMSSVYRGSFGHMFAPPAQVAATTRSLIRAGSSFRLASGGANYGWLPDVENSVLEYVLATRISANSVVAAPHNNWLTTSLGSGIQTIASTLFYDGVAWRTLSNVAAGAVGNEWSFSTPNGPLDLGWDPDRSFTIEARVFVPESTGNWQVIVAKENPRNYGMWVAPATWPQAGRLHFSYQLDGTTSLCPRYSVRRIDDLVTHHVAVRFDRRASIGRNIPEITFIIDGVVDSVVYGCGSVGPAASGAAGADSIQISSWMAPYSLVGDVRLYHRMVFNSEIAAHANRQR